MINAKDARIILRKRKMVDDEPKQLQNKRFKWVKKCQTEFGGGNDQFSLCEMYVSEDGNVIKTELEFRQFRKDLLYCNTRKKFPSETVAEIDSLDSSDAIKIFGTILESLIKQKIHFAMFYAEGGRSPHVRIYDFDEMIDLEPHQREKAQLDFWKNIIPLHYTLLDKSVWSDEHPLQLEFALHWKYDTPFDLICEHLPTNFENQTKLFFIDKKCNS